jgi:RNA polymerase-binding protein DksA
VAKKTTKKSSSPAKKAAPSKAVKAALPAAKARAAKPAKAKASSPARAGKASQVVETKPVIVGKPGGKNQAGLSAKDLQLFRELLLAKRRELLGDVNSMEDEALRNASGSNLSNLPLHMADMGTDNYEQEFTLGLVEKDRVLLREIHAALAKLQDGTYGLCEGTGKPISRVRLEAQPWTRYSIEYAKRMEQRPIRR